jgi:hypothetical protein
MGEPFAVRKIKSRADIPEPKGARSAYRRGDMFKNASS